MGHGACDICTRSTTRTEDWGRSSLARASICAECRDEIQRRLSDVLDAIRQTIGVPTT